MSSLAFRGLRLAVPHEEIANSGAVLASGSGLRRGDRTNLSRVWLMTDIDATTMLGRRPVHPRAGTDWLRVHGKLHGGTEVIFRGDVAAGNGHAFQRHSHGYPSQLGV